MHCPAFFEHERQAGRRTPCTEERAFGMKKTILSVSTYASLRKKVEQTLFLGQRKIEEAKVQTYWNTGRYIHEHILQNNGRAEYGRKVILKLARDLRMDESVLRRCLEFARKFPEFRIHAPGHELTWAHYRVLVAVPDEKKRLALADQASREEWNSHDLQRAVRNLNWESRAKASDGKPPSLLPVPALGPFHTYQVIAPGSIHSRAAEPLLDTGFSHTIKLSRFTSGKSPAAGAIVTSAKNAKGNYSLAPYGVRGTANDALYTYKAFVERVIDGDTLKLEIDTGFDEQCRETVRLRGIDCPEMNTPEGRAAKRFVERELGSCDSIILKSTQTRKEKWGRYLGDIFYTDKTGKQVYLNNLLLEKGYAVRVRS
jgi:endonuclease YncB( thermonuclease family)